MQLDPKNIKSFTPALKDPCIKLFCICKLSYIKSALYLLFAYMPPTFAAAIITASGFILFKNLNTAV